MSPGSPPVIEARGIRYAFKGGSGGHEVLHGIDAVFSQGEISLLTGPSGSGKTTFLSLVGALRRMQAGALSVQGDTLHDLPPEAFPGFRRRFGFIFQHHNLVPSITALENVMLAYGTGPSLPAPQIRESARAMLARLGLEHHTGHRPGQLSGGQKQRVAIARALVREPRIILADEPTASLDGASGRDIADLLRALGNQGATILIVTHDNRILDIADRIINMVDGGIVSNVSVHETAVKCGLLRKCPLFAGHTPDMLAEFAGRLTREAVPPGRVVVREGDPGDKFYIVAAGRLAVSGTALPVPVTLQAGDFFGEQALLTGNPRNATVQALEETELLSLGKEDFNKALARSKSFDQRLRETLYSRS
jgi:putative ABC transport system ATP-binding protein